MSKTTEIDLEPYSEYINRIQRWNIGSINLERFRLGCISEHTQTPIKKKEEATAKCILLNRECIRRGY